MTDKKRGVKKKSMATNVGIIYEILQKWPQTCTAITINKLPFTYHKEQKSRATIRLRNKKVLRIHIIE